MSDQDASADTTPEEVLIREALIAAEHHTAMELAVFEARHAELIEEAQAHLFTYFHLTEGQYVLTVTMPDDKRSLGWDAVAEIGPVELRAHDNWEWTYDDEKVHDLPSLGRAFTGKGYKLVAPDEDEGQTA